MRKQVDIVTEIDCVVCHSQDTTPQGSTYRKLSSVLSCGNVGKREKLEEGHASVATLTSIGRSGLTFGPRILYSLHSLVSTLCRHAYDCNSQDYAGYAANSPSHLNVISECGGSLLPGRHRLSALSASANAHVFTDPGNVVHHSYGDGKQLKRIKPYSFTSQIGSGYT